MAFLGDGAQVRDRITSMPLAARRHGSGVNGSYYSPIAIAALDLVQ